MRRTEKPYTIIHRPSGKWVLLKRGQFMSEHDTKIAAETAMGMCIKPEIYNYDELGKPIK